MKSCRKDNCVPVSNDNQIISVITPSTFINKTITVLAAKTALSCTVLHTQTLESTITNIVAQHWGKTASRLLSKKTICKNKIALPLICHARMKNKQTYQARVNTCYALY